MESQSLSRPENIDPSRQSFVVAVVVVLAAACLVVATAASLASAGAASQYPNSVPAGQPKFTGPDVQLSRCPSWELMMDSEYATYDRPEKVMLWYWGDRQMEGNRQGSVRRLAAHYQWGPLGLDLKRLPSLILFGNVTHISITTHLEMKLCL